MWPGLSGSSSSCSDSGSNSRDSDISKQIPIKVKPKSLAGSTAGSALSLSESSDCADLNTPPVATPPQSDLNSKLRAMLSALNTPSDEEGKADAATTSTTRDYHLSHKWADEGPTPKVPKVQKVARE